MSLPSTWLFCQVASGSSGSDVFRHLVEDSGDRAVRVGDIGPMRRENTVGFLAKQQVEGPAEDFAQGCAERFVEVGGGPNRQERSRPSGLRVGRRAPA